MTPDQFVRWLEGVKLTAPFTIADASELKAMIKTALGSDTIVEVHTLGSSTDKVFVLAKRGEVRGQ